MIKQLKFSLHMLRYSHGLIVYRIGSAITFLLGMIFEVTASWLSQVGSSSKSIEVHVLLLQTYWGFLVCFSGFFIMQAWYSLNASKFLIASPRGKAARCAVPSLITAVCSIGCFTLLVLTRTLLKLIFPYDNTLFAEGLYMTSIFVFVALIYVAFCNHYLFQSIFVFYVLIISYILIFLSNIPFVRSLSDFVLKLPARLPILFFLPVTLAICYGIILLGILLNYSILLLLYRKPLSKWSYAATLRKYL